MKTRLLTRLNILLASLVAMLGFSSCDGPKKYGPAPEDITAEYGVPYVELQESGTDSLQTPDNIIRILDTEEEN